MKVIKIILAVIVVAVISFFVWMSIVPPKVPGEITPPSNPFTVRIIQEIDSLSKAPVNDFSKDFHDAIQYRINDYHAQEFLGENDADNDKWFDILSRNLYSTYAPKFVEQAMFVFKGSDWKINDLKFIRNEKRLLQGSSYLEKNSNIDNSFKNISSIRNKYDEIAAFINSCNDFSYSYFAIDLSFPLNDVKDNIQKSRDYLNGELKNTELKNCKRLKDGLEAIPSSYFYKHVNYIYLKTQEYSDDYKEYNYQSDYSNNIYTPLKEQIEKLDNNIYGMNNTLFNANYDRLLNKLNADNSIAFNYFRDLLKKGNN